MLLIEIVSSFNIYWYLYIGIWLGNFKGDFNNNCFVCVFMLCCNNELFWEIKI